MPPVHADRRARLLTRVAALGADAALVAHPAAVRYLTGAVRRHAALLLAPDRCVLAVRADDPAQPPNPEPPRPEGVDVRQTAHGDPLLEAAAADRSRTLAVEEHVLTVERHRSLAAALPAARLTGLGRAVEQLRVVKDDEELRSLRAAAEIADQALGEILESIIVGRTERHLALELERRMIDHGAEQPAFPVSVGTGPNSGLARHRPGERRVEEGDFLTVSLGAVHEGYHTATTRTYAVGPAPAPWQIDLHEKVFAAQRAVREALRPGAACAQVAAAVAGFPDGADGFEAAGADEVGGGIGLEIGEEPRIGPGSMGKLDACVPVTAGLGARVPGRGGVRLEDTLVVRPEADGGPELLTITTKELLAL